MPRKIMLIHHPRLSDTNKCIQQTPTICAMTEHRLASNFGISFLILSNFSSYTSMVQKMERVIKEGGFLGWWSH
jgi:hypothetical protein